MTSKSGGDTVNQGVNQGGASKPKGDERDREFAGITGNAPEQGEKPSPADRDRGETSSADECPPIDLDTAHDRAS
jgi:hypothetical protein